MFFIGLFLTMTLLRKFLLFIFLFLSQFLSESVLASYEGTLKNDRLFIIAPPIINKDYYLIEYGFSVLKHVKNYDYNAYVKAALFEDWLNRPDDLKAGALGFKAGILMPLNKSLPLSFQFGGGFAKAVLHKSPVFGKTEQSQSRNNLFLLEAGLTYKYQDYLVNLVYQRNNVGYFSRKLFLSFGVNY